ncbi:MAG: response regulator [Candidatus Abyssobacteria bacterium SURF_5]|uniref:Response regulator n=1 Tax=Abyssobacteria bacterium (strain SURF_5) TaxID=2093360 RepID=A0A3A4P1Y0_ABYX5|nr:MAG: response regulator [Candidatus Abyssubacteria bacterium SURF_5]
MTTPSEKTVLVVDDEPDILLFLQTALEDAGFNVVTASNGDEALQRVKECPPDFISCDLVMPKKSGVRFLYELRKHKEWARIPIVVVTAHARDELGSKDLKEILDGKILSGPQVYLEKPVRAEDFVGMVKRELGIVETAPSKAAESTDALKKQVQELLNSADPEALKEAARILKAKRT